MLSPSELEAGDANDNSDGHVAPFSNKGTPRLRYGNTSRFGVVKGSIAARRAIAAAAAAAKVEAPQTEATEHTPTLSSSKTSLLATRVATTVIAAGDAPDVRSRQSTLDVAREHNRSIGEENREKDRRREDEQASRLLGPMGSFYELAKVPSAADLIRTASHDKSSHSVSQARGLRQANVPTAYSAIANTGYYRPSDRIGRLYTSTAAALTSSSAQSVAKTAATLAVAAGAPAGSGSSGGGAGGIGGGRGGALARNNGGSGKLVTAPFAAESRQILHTLALQPASSRGALAAALSLGTSSSTAVAARPEEGGGNGNQSPSPTGADTSSEAFGPRSPGSPARPKKVVVIDSEQHTRTQRREMRSPPRGRRILEVAPYNGGVGPSGGGGGGGAEPTSGEATTAPNGGGGFKAKDFRTWNPAILGGIGGGGGGGVGSASISQRTVLDGGDSIGASGGGTGEAAAGGDTVVRVSEAERQKESIDRYWTTVEDRLLNGSPNALGAGAKSPLLELPPERVDGITSRLAFELRFIPGIELGAYQAYVEAAVNSMLQDVQVGHSVAVARAVVDYELKDPEGRRSLGIERGHLTAGPKWYQCQEYLIPEWRVLRQTGVSRERVRRSALALKRRLCSVETVMVGLEKLWHSGVVPGDWDTAAFGGSGDVVYADVLFTDVKTATFWSTLPMSLDAFCSHVERRANECREAMQEFWLSDAAGLVGQYVGPLIHSLQNAKGRGGRGGGVGGGRGWDDTGRHLDGATVQLRSGLQEEAGGGASQGGGGGGAEGGGGGVDDVDAEEEFDQWFEQSPAGTGAASKDGGSGRFAGGRGDGGENGEDETQTLLERRMELEAGQIGGGDLGSGSARGMFGDGVGLYGTGGGGSRHRSGGRFSRAPDPSARLTGILESVSMLMSRHLRGTVERSLDTFVHLFERVSHPHHSGDATFVLSLHVNEEAFDDLESRSQARNEVSDAAGNAGEVSASKMVMTVEPTLEELQEHVCACVDQIISASQRFPRVDQSLIPPPPECSTKTLGPCTVVLSDEIVLDAKSRVRDAIATHMAAPMRLLQEFERFVGLMDGTEEAKVQKALEERGQMENTQAGITVLQEVAMGLKRLALEIREAVPDLNNYPMFSVKCLEATESLAKKADALHTLIMEEVASDNRTHMAAICKEYQEMVNQLVTEPSDSAELKSLQEYTRKALERLGGLLGEYTNQVYVRTNFLLDQGFRASRDDLQLFHTTYNWPHNVKTYLARSAELQRSRKQDLEMVVEGQQEQLLRETAALGKKIDKIAEAGSLVPGDVHNCVRRIVAVQEALDRAEAEADSILEQETLLGMPLTDNLTPLSDLRDALDPMARLWTTAKDYLDSHHTWLESPLRNIDSEAAERQADDLMRTAMRSEKELAKVGAERAIPASVATALSKEIKDFIEDEAPLMMLMSSPGIKKRHWDQIVKITGIALPYEQDFVLRDLLDAGLQNVCADIEETCVAASKEYSLENNMNTMEKEWSGLVFETKEYRTSGTRILASVDETQQLLDDHIVKTQAMRGSRYIGPFLDRIVDWEKTLNDLQEIMDNWLKMQATWLYLEPIFSSDDIMRQMPVEGRLFQSVDQTWREHMQKTFEDPAVLSVARRQGFLEALLDANAKLDVIQKGLNDYLETKRLAFPRFYFLSNDELLEILAETKDPLRVQPHLKKCFDGISKLEFQPNLDITACLDPGDERIDFPYEQVGHAMVNPNNSGGNVERWLVEVEIMMKKGLAYAIDSSMVDHASSDRMDWVQRWPGQVMLVVNQQSWTHTLETVITRMTEDPEALKKHWEFSCEELLRTVELVRTDINKNLRTSLGAMVVMDVHNRDTTEELAALQISDIGEFDWLAQLRYYWEEGGQSALSGEPGSITCKMINAIQLYGYEYLGNNGRLVITPLTDRCYRTLMGAIHLNLGGAPEGPAGTGKTETTKDLGKAIAIQCVVTNCSDGLDYLAMGKFFKGLASSGAWACFDEFNRIQLEVLSVVAQQVLCIQQAKARGLKRFVFEGTELNLVHTCCPFITMNPGYAGRAELPDNLKVLFRTVAMMVPDYGMISEIILYSFGYTDAKKMSVKIVTTYKLCSEQLSSQSHYDYGMRAVVAVLRAAGNLKRSDPELPEDILVLRSIIDVNLPKFLFFDVPLFNGIVSDLFPGVKVPDPDRDAMRKAFNDGCDHYNLQPTAYFWEKVVQIYDMMVVRHGFMIVGLPFSGKTMAWKVLAFALGLLHTRYPEDPRWSKVIPFLMNPKSIAMGQLYGQFDPTSHEWTDGVLAIQYRNAASNKVGEPEDRKWILFDGPVDAIWIENMNTVLDDNKKLCLMSGEIIAMSGVMSMMFEPMDLLVASPATVSRCGMIYMEPEKLGWQPVLDSWIRRHREKDVDAGDGNPADGGETGANASGDAPDPEPSAVNGPTKFTLTANECLLVRELFAWLVEPCLAFLRREVSEMVPTVDTNLVQSLINIMECQLEEAFEAIQGGAAGGRKQSVSKGKGPAGGAEGGATLDPKAIAMRAKHIECCFMFGVVWSLGSTGVEAGQKAFLEFLDNIVVDLGVIETEWDGVNNALQVRKWNPPNFSEKGRAFSGKLCNPCPARDGGARAHFYNPSRGEWVQWVNMLPELQIPDAATMGDIVVPNSYTAQYNSLLTMLLNRDKKTIVCGPTGTGKSTYVFRAITQALPQDKFKPLTLGFSAKTSANMTQDIIDGKLDKRRKGVYGPPMGQTAIIFVDDLNMPEVETYGAQPPLELLRQMIDNGGWYNLKDMTWQTIVDTVVVGAMGPPGGGRNHITPRLLRHFNILCFLEFDDSTLTRIFKTIVDWHFNLNKCSADIKATTGAIVGATLETFRSATVNLLPTPTKSHYTFNLRDFSRVIQGVLMVKPKDGFGKANMVRLWVHESLRVFGDRLVDDSDREWFLKHLNTMVSVHFGTKLYEVCKHLDTEGEGSITTGQLRKLFFGDYTAPEGSDNKPYEEVADLEELQGRMVQSLGDYNARSRKPMDLVMFMFAVEHVSRLARLLKMPGGNGLLVGVGGSGRQSCTRLAVHMADYTLFQIEISKNYGHTEWREDLKTVLKGAGTGNTPMAFLFSDTQIINESFVEDINNMLNSGEVPNIFPNDERVAICEAVRPFAKKMYGKAAAEMTQPQLYAYFLTRVRANLHIVLAFSPIGEAFRDRLRKFPSLINCCAIDWFTAWPGDALVAVAEMFLASVEFDSDDTRRALVESCQRFHEDSRVLSAEFLSKLKRQNYVTPTSYLELITAFKTSLAAKRDEISAAKKRYEVGLEKLAFATESVNAMQEELEALKPVLAQSQKDTEALMEEIKEKLPGVELKRTEVQADAAVAEAEAAECLAGKKSVEEDLSVAMPALNAAIKALDTIKQSETNEVKALAKPPIGVKIVCEAVCVMLGIKPVRIPDPEDPSKRIMDFWGPSQKMLGEADFIAQLKGYDKDDIPAKTMAEIRKKYVTDPRFTPEAAEKASKAAAGLCKWVYAMETYDRVAKVVGPKKEALKLAEEELEVTMAQLRAKQAELQAVEDGLAALQGQYDDALKKKADLEASVENTNKKLERATTLIEGLGGEKARWLESADRLGVKYVNLTGDVLVSAGVMAYLGPFTATFRSKQLSGWVALCKDKSIPCSASPTLSGTLGDPVLVRQWNIDGLPTDGFSVDNGIIWIQNLERENKLTVIKLTDGDYLRTLENAVQFGQPVLLENVGEELDPSLEPLLLKQIFKQGGCDCIRLGDSTVEYSENFRFYITTKLRNPHYLPEISVKVTLLNFMITPEGLQDQVLSDDIKVKQVIADKTEKDIDEVRRGYTPIAYSSQILFFCISDLANIEPVYQYSLTWFINLFVSSIHRSEKSRDIPTRLEKLDTHFTFALYQNVCRSLLEKDKLLFSFLLCTRIMGGKGEVDQAEWLFFLTGGSGLDNPHENPCPEWLEGKNWDALCRLDNLPAFDGLREEFESQQDEWKAVYDSTEPEKEPFPGRWAAELTGIRALCTLRCIRADKVAIGVQTFVVSKMGDRFVKPPVFDLNACFNDSSCATPLVFILSPGSDPMGAVLKAADGMGVKVSYISLGQGQGPVAERMIEKAQVDGSWVVLQNCHLCPSWMTVLEKTAESLHPDVTNASFRLWCTTYPSDVFPVSVLQNGVKMTIEAPKGLRANLKASYSSDPISDDSFFESCTKGPEFRKLLFGLCFFHALVQERRMYGPIGWNIPYEFNDSDLRISAQQLAMFLNENARVPFKALNYTAGECNYGGRVTDDKDRRTLHCVLHRMYHDDLLTDGAPLSASGDYVMPPDGPRRAYLEYIESLPLTAAPEVFGLHDNASITRAQSDTAQLLKSVLLTESSGGGSGGADKETTINTVAADILSKIPVEFDMEAAQIRYPVRWDESMNTVLCQELQRFNNLTNAIKSSLVNIQKAVKGLVVMSAALEVLGNELFFGKIPTMWSSNSYPSRKTLAGYVGDLLQRLAFFGGWLRDKPPPVFWVSGFFFTQAFLTGASQNFARRYTIPIDHVGFSQQSMPKVLFSSAPIIWFKPQRKSDVVETPSYACPVYKTSDRRGILSTTGHSTNFICFIMLATNLNESHWVQRGVAMLTSLDD
eukprot:g15323.t1